MYDKIHYKKKIYIYIYVGITEISTQFPVETQREGDLRVAIDMYPLFPLLYKSTTL